MLLLPLICIIWDAFFFLRSGWWFDFCCCSIFTPKIVELIPKVDYYFSKKSWFNRHNLFAFLFLDFFGQNGYFLLSQVEGWKSSTPHEEDFFHGENVGKIPKKSSIWNFAGRKVPQASKEREVQQKLWNFSSQNLVNVAWSFAKAGVNYSSTEKTVFFGRFCWCFSIWHFFRRSSSESEWFRMKLAICFNALGFNGAVICFDDFRVLAGDGCPAEFFWRTRTMRSTIGTRF